MYYFRVPVFTKLSRIQNIIFLTLQLIILIISITISLYRGCNYQSTNFVEGCKNFDILPGNTLITDKTSGIWQFLTPIKYSSEKIQKISTMEYFNTYNSTYNGYVLMKGNIVIFDHNINNYVALFKEFLLPVYYDDFNYYFKKKVNMNKEIYSVAIHNGFLQLAFLNNCSTNPNLIEDTKKHACSFTNEAIEDINKFLLNYFDEKFVVPYTCNDCYKNNINSIDELISVASKCISIFILFNTILIIIFIFVLSKILKFDIGYIENIINHDEKINKEKSILYIE